MEELPLCVLAPHGIFRNGHPYFMIRVPADLTHKFNKQFIRKSLKTQSQICSPENYYEHERTLPKIS
ncbi:MAG: hypothetical protein C0614_08210 [Desulfuromonas sp.]|nr:MAG: hypothetical protein C0614_08210 [Desulfuromonas sp.]